MTVVIIALTAVMVAAYTMIARRFAGMIAGQPLPVAIAGRVSGMIRPAATAAISTTITATVATTASASASATSATTTLFRNG
jgi:hypothetical protein